METAIHFHLWNLARQALQPGHRPVRHARDCGHGTGIWRRLRGSRGQILVRGSWYCADQCLDKVLGDTVQELRSRMAYAAPAHRVPLGLLLLSRQQITPERLRLAIEAQRFAGHGRIGEWLQTLGFASEHQITAALARQWGCPIRRILPAMAGLSRAPGIPMFLLQSAAMIPFEYVESTSTLHVAFGEGIDRSVLYALEQMLDCHTEPCLVVPSLLRQSLQSTFDRRGPREVVFDRIADIGECVQITRSYCARVDASEIRMACCGRCLWMRLLSGTKPPMDLLFRLPNDARDVVPHPFFAGRPKVSPAPADRN